MEDRRGEERWAKSLISSGVDHGAHTPINTHRVGFLLQPLSLRLTPITCTNTVDQQRGLAPHTGPRGTSSRTVYRVRSHENHFVQKVTQMLLFQSKYHLRLFICVQVIYVLSYEVDYLATHIWHNSLKRTNKPFHVCLNQSVPLHAIVKIKHDFVNSLLLDNANSKKEKKKSFYKEIIK